MSLSRGIARGFSARFFLANCVHFGRRAWARLILDDASPQIPSTYLTNHRRRAPVTAIKRRSPPLTPT